MLARLRHRRLRWALTVSLALVLAVHTLSGVRLVRAVWAPRWVAVLTVDGGRCTLLTMSKPRSVAIAPRVSIRPRQGPRFGWWWWWDRDNFRAHWLPQQASLVFPLGAPLTVLGVLTFLAWREQRRFVQSGRCECGYELAGLERVGGAVRCPECGRESRARSPAGPLLPGDLGGGSGPKKSGEAC